MRDADKPFDDADLEKGRLLFSRPCRFMLGVVSLDKLPEATLPEVCMAGRSNVGKSSLINALTGTRALARTSDTPGRTQEVNFFSLDDRLLLADLPGYGYARAPQDQVKKWTRLVKSYLRGRPNLRRVFLLVDSRHGLKDSDREIMSMLDTAAVNYQIVLTKTDKLRGDALESVMAKTQQELAKHGASHPLILCTSSTRSEGLDHVRAEIAAIADN
ncbi:MULTISPECIES: ribosome biogenesis GTP-binding protein YihA/YsxC [unclassified Haematospirillum]|uniref:ribosome biogenesis GTP-binding protein YihA/YsxC n=1 Tax=unclassified Haematospirillum TaxID=2622088 RepID=UPI001439810B|nr:MULTISPECIES: ribosome biogenesis GTP-binding protein YihA/YsxC [unclassified Haematospirillum]NKD55272.1 YihA family ribosome biogenesis GTP-binding protein [Haematospirillum sp. H4890]NKD75157.1 YihA family ribosome biogenesis GTP-binding protein [Haematospirillum sp. H4485]